MWVERRFLASGASGANFPREGATAQRRNVENPFYVAPLRLCAFSQKIQGLPAVEEMHTMRGARPRSGSTLDAETSSA